MTFKSVFMASCNNWNSPFRVGSHHLARGFVEQGCRVAFISDPISPIHLLQVGTKNMRRRFALFMAGGSWVLNGHLWTYVPAALLTPYNKPVLRSKFVHHAWPRWTLPNVVSKVKRAGFGTVDLLYLDSVIQSCWLETLQYKRSVFRIADDLKGFARTTPEMQALEKKIASSVDLTVYTARELEPHVRSLQPKAMLYLPNGVDFDHFDRATCPKPLEFKDIPGPIAIYVGSMNEWFDFELVNFAARSLPQVSFVLIGPPEYGYSRFEKLPNIYILGGRDYADIPSYLINADIGIIPFDVNNHSALVNKVNPLKLYEYLACGLPVVSTTWDELNNLNSPAVLCSTADQFIQAIGAAITLPQEKETFRSYAATQDWSIRIRQLMDALL